MRNRLSAKNLLLICLAALVAALMAPSTSSAASANDAFYKYTGTQAALNKMAPGAVIKTRTIPYHVVGVPIPLTTTQLLYRATNARGQATVNVTSVIEPFCFLICPNKNKAISYQSFYDSLNPDDQPSVQIAGGLSLTGAIPQIETALFVPYLLAGYTVITSDTQGQTANFAAGPEYGTNTLDSIQAAVNSSKISLNKSGKVAMLGYSGGAIATEWAAELAPSYAPKVNKMLVGAAFGGVLVHPGHNLRYVEGSSIWAGVMPMAIMGIARAYDINMKPYLNDYGQQLYNKGQKFSIINVLGQYAGLKWTDMVKPQYSVPESVPEYVAAANKVIMGTGGTPTTPMFIGQGTGGDVEGTPGNKPGIGKGDGVMIAGDVRTLAKKYCDKKVKVQYNEYGLSHMTTPILWLPEAIAWTFNRLGALNSLTLTNNCSKIKAGNPLDPIKAL